jgi:hypothetical protein
LSQVDERSSMRKVVERQPRRRPCNLWLRHTVPVVSHLFPLVWIAVELRCLTIASLRTLSIIKDFGTEPGVVATGSRQSTLVGRAIGTRSMTFVMHPRLRAMTIVGPGFGCG